MSTATNPPTTGRTGNVKKRVIRLLAAALATMGLIGVQASTASAYVLGSRNATIQAYGATLDVSGVVESNFGGMLLTTTHCEAKGVGAVIYVNITSGRLIGGGNAPFQQISYLNADFDPPVCFSATALVAPGNNKITTSGCVRYFF